MLSRPEVYQYLSSIVAVSVGNEAYYIAPSILHDGHDGAETKRERLVGQEIVPAVSPSPSGTSSLFLLKTVKCCSSGEFECVRVWSEC